MSQMPFRLRSPGDPAASLSWTARSATGATQAVLAAGFIAVYVLLDWMVPAYATGPLADTPWNPSPGIGLAWLLVFGVSWAPLLFIAALLANYAGAGPQFSLAQSLLQSALLTAGYAGLAYFLRAGPLSVDLHLSRMRDMIIFTLATTAATLLIAALLVLLLSDIARPPRLEDAPLLVRVWIGDLVGVLVFTPLILLLWSRPLRFTPRDRNAFTHVFGIFLSALFGFWVVYGNNPAEQITSLYLMFLPLIWAALRFGLPGALLTLLVLQAGIILLSQMGSQGDATVLQFQIRLLAIAVTGLFLGVAVDDLHNAEQKLRERQAELNRSLRLAASAELATAMAHELNQPLSAIGIYTRICEMLLQARPVPELQDTMVKIGAEVRRAGEVVHKLREFYRSGGSRLESTAVAKLLRTATQFIQERAERHGIAMVVDAGVDLPPVSVDRMQIETVLHNLLANAVEAIRDAGGSSERLIRLRAAAAANEMVEITVQDSGPGLSETEAKHLFHPFTSSKSYGLGLGLSMSRSIVAAHGGNLEIVPGKGGCCFRFTLPCAMRAIIN